MAEIKVQIKGDNEDFKRKMAESGAEARGFAAQVKEQFAGLKESVADIAGETGFGGLKKVLTGLGGVAFGAMIVEQFKKAIEAGLEWEKQVAALKTALPQGFQGMAESMQEWVESVSGGMGTVDENIRVFRALLQSGMNVREAQTALIDLQNAAAKVGVSVEELGMKFAEMKSIGEVPARFFRELPALAPIARGLGMQENPSAEWMLKTLLPNIAPGGLQSPVRQEMERTASAQLAKFGVELENLSQTVGVELLPAMKDFVGWFRAELPVISEDLKAFAAALAGVLKWIGSFAPAFTRAEPGQFAITGALPQVGPRPDYSGIWNFLGAGFKDALTPITQTHEKLDAAADKLNRALDPK